MKTILTNLPTEKAQKELKQFLVAGYIIATVALFAFGWLAVAGIGIAGRTVLLSYHQGNKTNPKIKQLRAASILLLLISIAEFVLWATHN